MSLSSVFDRRHSQARASSWLWLFSIFCRVSLAFGFIVAGMVKIGGERFAGGLSANHPMGNFLEALHRTGYYYTFIGIAQIAAAIMLLIPRTVTLGAFVYFPIILNIFILTYATRFDGSSFTSPLMTLANLFLIGWNYEKWKYILPFNRLETEERASGVQVREKANWRGVFSGGGMRLIFERLRVFLKQLFSEKFPWLFFAGVLASVVFFISVYPLFYSVLPRNTLAQCLTQFKDTDRAKAGENFCHCIHTNGEPLDKCLDIYNNAPENIIQIP